LKTLHIATAVRQKTEVKAKVKILRVVGNQRYSFELLEISMFESRVNQPRSQPSPSESDPRFCGYQSLPNRGQLEAGTGCSIANTIGRLFRFSRVGAPPSPDSRNAFVFGV